MEPLSLSSVSSTLQAFIESSSLGQFHARLLMLLSFHCHLLLLPSQPGQGQQPATPASFTLASFLASA